MRTMLEKVIYDLNPFNPAVARQVEMRVEFSIDYDTLARQIKQEQSKAVVFLDYLAKAEQTVGKMQDQRRYEESPRWQANYDLLYAQLIAYQARMYEYGAYIDQFAKDVEAYVKNPANPKNAFKPPPKTKAAPMGKSKTKPPDLVHDQRDLVDRAAVRCRPGAPFGAVDRAEIAVLVRPFIPDADAVLLQVADIGVAG